MVIMMVSLLMLSKGVGIIETSNESGASRSAALLMMCPLKLPPIQLSQL